MATVSDSHSWSDLNPIERATNVGSSEGMIKRQMMEQVHRMMEKNHETRNQS